MYGEKPASEAKLDHRHAGQEGADEGHGNAPKRRQRGEDQRAENIVVVAKGEQQTEIAKAIVPMISAMLYQLLSSVSETKIEKVAAGASVNQFLEKVLLAFDSNDLVAFARVFEEFTEQFARVGKFRTNV